MSRYCNLYVRRCQARYGVLAGHGTAPVTQDVPELRFLARVSELCRPALAVERDIRGYRVLDVEAKEVGRVSDLLVDAKSRRVRFVEISTSDRQEPKLLVPFNQLTVVGRDRVILPSRLEDLVQPRR